MALDYLLIRRVAAQSISSGSETLISWDTEDSDVSGYWTSGTPTRIIVPADKAGKFIFTCSWVIGSFGDEQESQLLLNHYNSSDTLQRSYSRPVGNQEEVGTNSPEIALAVADYVTASYYQTTGGSRNFTGRLEMIRLGD